MSSNLDENEILNRIEKERYLISCKCTLCNTPFKDIMLGTLHITDKHPKRKIRNVIENLSWDVKEDLKKWEILQALKESRESIIQKLTDENIIAQAEIPDVVEIQRKKANISEIMKALQDDLKMAEKKPEEEEVEVAEEEIDEIEEEIDQKYFEDSEEEINGEEEITEPSEEGEIEKEDESEKSTSLKKSKKRNLCDLLERELEKYIDSIKRLPMASQVEQFIKSKNKDQVKLYKYAEQADYFLGVAKAIKIIKDSKQDLEIII